MEGMGEAAAEVGVEAGAEIGLGTILAYGAAFYIGYRLLFGKKN
ncbi:MAG: hypothetical protein O2904_01695 [bacterium]|nr:hypothetical protein [bacterium]